MANMTFGTNILPASGNNSLSLGNSEQRWNVYGDVIGDLDGTASNVATAEDTANDLYLLGVTSGATTAVKRNTDAVLGESILSLKNKNIGSTDVSLCVDISGKNGLYVNGYYDGSNFVSDPKWLIVRNSDGNTYLAAGGVIVNYGDFKVRNGNAIIRRRLSQWPALHFQGSTTDTLSNDNRGSIYYDCATPSSTGNSKFMFRELSSNSSTGAALTTWEDYWLPDCNTDRTANSTYYILTTKSAVTVAQGGTGATTAANAGNNLSLTQTVALSVGSGLSAIFTRIGKIVNVYIPSIPSQTIAAWGTLNLCSIPSGYYSASRTPQMVLPRQSATTYCPVFLVANGSSGMLTLTNQSGSSQTTGMILPMSFTWSLA